jgi:aspartate-semialdehyde dehydrogenase
VNTSKRSDWRLPKKAAYWVLVVGAGAVGEEMVRVLRQRDFPVESIDLRARSERTMTIDGEEYQVRVLGEDVPEGTDLVLMAGAEDAIPEFAWEAAKAGAIAIDNSSAWRMDERVPLVVPEVNPEDVQWHQGLIANPNCSTIQMVVALMPLHRVSPIKRIIVSTYQSVSGTGRAAMEELRSQNRAVAQGEPIAPPVVYPRQIALNCIPQIGSFRPDGSCTEEWKMVAETQKILHEPDLAVTATTVRVPSMVGHGESVYIETESRIGADQAASLLRQAPGVVVWDSVGDAGCSYPTPLDAAGEDPVYVGRIRDDLYGPTGLNLWVVADNLRKGAALNAVQIAELLLP